MGTTFRPYQPDQMLLLPQDLREWVPEGHLAHHVSDLVDALDLGAFYAPYKGDGRRNSPYDPRMMVKVLIYAYGTGTFSSRKMAGKLEEDIAFRMLAAGNFPQHRRSSPELCVKVRGSSSMLLLGCLGDLLRFEKREIQVATFAPDRSSP